ncbi:histidine kinase [Virgisporangium aliadipatigenens]|uniref:histidine kinase n=1 Tax=Virgisporangium aliadipatigenens TaxID=741659 RepID=A0A8J4DT19_9ACTN|nr:ATP-binding protein [Virgisporangium aliadipatigenens]GIJ48463.1 histidine kinase [Virgisporangium aliadipatigenens]
MDRVGTLEPDDLRKLFLFEKLSEEQLAWLSEHGWVAEAEAGEFLLREGEPVEVFVVLLSGTMAMSRRVGQDDVETIRTDQVGVYAGATQSYLDSSDRQTYTATVRTVSPVRVFALTDDDFAWAMRTWFPMAIHLLDGLMMGMRRGQEIIGQRQHLLALGALSAGLTHELNNPAAAAVRATSELRGRVAGMRSKLSMMAHKEIEPVLLEMLVELQEEAIGGVADAPTLSAVQESEREDEIGDWLEEHGVEDGWDLAPIFVNAGTTTEFLDKIADRAPEDLLELAVRWVSYCLETELLINEITDSVTRMSTLVSAAKQYSHMDRAPFERADIHLGLKSTMIMLSGKLQGIEVVKDFDRTLPPVPVYAGELNQVWTNLIDNAVQAMNGSGTLTVRTYEENGNARVEIGDTGPGIPPELRQRIFEPFFTTKPVGQGTGLGLDVAYRIVVGRHGGSLTVESEPGNTRFIVCLPLTERPAEAAV